MALETTLDLTNDPSELAELLEQKGRQVAKYNPRLTGFAKVLAHPEFAEFFEQNFSTWDDCQQAIMLLKMGAHLKSVLSQSVGEDVSGHQLAAAMEKVMYNPESRQYLVQRFKDFSKDIPKDFAKDPSSSQKQILP